MTTGIETVFDGTRFRSRLEARWAYLFSRLNWKWEYEPFDADGYIPDFVVMGPNPLLVEVKPDASVQDLSRYVHRLETALASHWHHDILIVGMTPLLVTGETWLTAWGDTRQDWVCGLLGERMQEGQGGDFEWCFANGEWNFCLACENISVFHEYQSYAGRPCGCHDGDHYLSGTPDELLSEIWADARNITQWKKR